MLSENIIKPKFMNTFEHCKDCVFIHFLLDLKRRVIDPYPHSCVSMATTLIPGPKKPLVLRLTTKREPFDLGETKGSNISRGSYNNLDMRNITSTKGVNLLIFSYMRGGSSMNGKVFAEMDENFFVHEPLIQLAPHHYLTEDELCEVQTKHCRYTTSGTHFRVMYTLLNTTFT